MRIFCVVGAVSLLLSKHQRAGDSFRLVAAIAMNPLPRLARALVAAAMVLFATACAAGLDIDAKAVKTDANDEEEIWAIRIDLENTGTQPDPVPAGAIDARQFQLTGSRLTLSGTAAAAGIAATALLERIP